MKPKTFEEYWATQPLSSVPVTNGSILIIESFKTECEKAWNAALESNEVLIYVEGRAAYVGDILYDDIHSYPFVIGGYMESEISGDDMCGKYEGEGPILFCPVSCLSWTPQCN